MTSTTSHSGRPQSNDSQAVYADLERSFQRNRLHVAALRALVTDIEKHPAGDATDRGCMVPVFELLLRGAEAELSPEDLRYLAAIGVPPELIRGNTTER